MKNKRDSKTLLVFGLLLTIVFMSVGYAALSQRLTIQGTADIGDANWGVKITEIEFDAENSTISAESTSQGFDPAEAAVGQGSNGVKFDVTLFEPGDTATYVITVKNNGTIDARLKEISSLTAKNAEAPTDITYEIVADPTNSEVLAANGTHTYTVTVNWSADATSIPEVSTKSATIYLDYDQA